MLQCVAVCCSVLQCVTVCQRARASNESATKRCSVFQCVAVYCSVLQRVVLQCVACVDLRERATNSQQKQKNSLANCERVLKLQHGKRKAREEFLKS